MIPYVLANDQWWWILVIVGVFAVIVLLVMFLKKKVKIFQNEEKPKSDKEIAAEEVNRLLVDVEEPLQEKKEESEDK